MTGRYTSPRALRFSAASLRLGAGEDVPVGTLRKKAPADAQPRGTPERDAQKAVVAWLRAVLPPGSLVWATVNESPAQSRDPHARARFYASRRAAGVVTGWPDVGMIVPGPRTVMVEMKAPGYSPSDVSEEQRRVHAGLRALGIPVGICTGIDDVRAFLLSRGVRLREACA